jgi:hypothetical protein
VTGNSTTLVEEANISFNNVKKYMDFVRKSIADGDKNTCFDDARHGPAKQDIVGILASAGLKSSAVSTSAPAGLVASSAADKIAKTYCTATLKVSIIVV